jgi:integrase
VNAISEGWKDMVMEARAASAAVEGKQRERPFAAPIPIPAAAPVPVHEEKLRGDLVGWVRQHAVESTRLTYAPHIRQFHDFCNMRGLQSFPASDATVAEFLKFRYQSSDVSRSTIGVASAAIASEYKLTGLESPTQSPLVAAVKAVIAREGKPIQRKEPLTPDLFKRIIGNSRPGSWIDARDDFMIALAFTTGMRESNEMALRMTGDFQDVWLDTYPVNGVMTEVLFVFLEKSKTDQIRNGHTLVVGPAHDQRICPIALFKRWMGLRNPLAPFLFHARNKIEKLSATIPNGRLKHRLKRIGVDPRKYGSHSARRGLATQAAKAGVQERLIKKHCNWRSDAVYVYIEESLANRLSVSAAILND